MKQKLLKSKPQSNKQLKGGTIMNEEKLKMLLLILENMSRDEWNRFVSEVNEQYSYQADKVGLASDNCQQIESNYKHYGF